MKRLYLLLMILFFSFTLVACGSKPQGETKVTDMVGREVSVTLGSYKRVICIGAGALRLYSYVGDVNLLCGVEDIDNDTLDARPKMFDKVARPYFIAYHDVFATLPSCGVGGPQAQTAEPEKILACNPDLVISEYEDVDKENSLQEALGVPVITVRYGNQGVFDENIKNSITLLGKVLGKDTQAEKLNNYIASEKKAIEDRVKNIVVEEQSKVYICGLGNWGTTNHLMTAKNFAPFTVAKINNIANDLANNGVQAIEAEKFASYASNMDIIIIDSAAIKNISDPSVFADTKAWTNGEVYLQMAYNAYYTNVEIALINTWYNAKVVYPQLFSDIDMTAKTNEVTKAFLGKELATEIFAYQNSFGGYHKISTTNFPNA